MLSYPHLFFDLDHTLWDFDRNSGEALHELYEQHRLDALFGFGFEHFFHHFRQINIALWHQYNLEQIDRDTLREQRFVLLQEALGVPPHPVFEQINQAYMQLCPTKPHLMPHALPTLEYLKRRGYCLHILSNGFGAVQHLKMKQSGIFGFFQSITTSESIGCRKPSRQIFDYALAQAKTTARQALMIGDSLLADVQGAQQAGIEAIFYNPYRQEANPAIRQIQCLSELQDLL